MADRYAQTIVISRQNRRFSGPWIKRKLNAVCLLLFSATLIKISQLAPGLAVTVPLALWFLLTPGKSSTRTTHP